MRALHTTLWLVALIPLSSCVRHSKIDERIPNGVYRDLFKTESLTVRDGEIEVKIRIPNPRFPGLFERTYRYGIERRSNIYFRGSSNDPVLVEGILSYDWIWDGKNIKRLYRKPQVVYGENWRERYVIPETMFVPEAPQ
jgi:hypothetical protein